MDNPELYAKYNHHVLKDNHDLLEKYSKIIKWKDNEIILEVGSGDGRATVEVLLPRLPKNFKKLIISDISENMVNYVKRKHNIPKAEMMVLDIASETIPTGFENKFDHIFSFYALHFTEQRQAYSNIFKMLKPGGEVISHFCAINAQEKAFPSMQKKNRWAKYEHEKFFSIYRNSKDPEREMEDIVKQVGFKNVICRIEDKSHFFPDYETFKGFYLSLNQTISQIPKEDLEDYCNDFLEEIKNSDTISIYKDENNQESFEMKFKVFFVFASK